MNINENHEFVERADFLAEDELVKWTVENQFFEGIQQKILEKGAKLIVGPRGTGKTHQFKHAFFTCLHKKENPLAVYVSFGKYYHLEPLLFQSSNAISIFHAWVLSKIIISCYEILKITNKNEIELLYSNELNFDDLSEFVQKAERFKQLQEFEPLIKFLSIQKTIEILEDLAEKLSKKRTILLLDDAALTLTPDYMIEFFDIFRSLKTMHISPKASVYPGTTQYGPRFHVGQDAEEVKAWINVDSQSYKEFMNNILIKRFDKNININEDIIELLQYAAFGIPRAFITLLRDYIKDDGTNIQQKFNNVINNRKKQLEDEYQSLSIKLPQYKSIIGAGLHFFNHVIEDITQANKNENNEKQIHIGILTTEALNHREDRMLKFLIEAGLLYESTPLHDGPDREYIRYIPHFLFLIQNRAFSNTKGFNAKGILENIRKKSNKRPLRRQLKTLLTEEEIADIKLNLPQCKSCGAERLTEEQKFCHQCGSVLIGQSAFEACLKLNIDVLPISDWQKDRIKNETTIKTIEDLVIAQSPVAELKKAKGIGQKRSSKIIYSAQNIVDEFLA